MLLSAVGKTEWGGACGSGSMSTCGASVRVHGSPFLRAAQHPGRGAVSLFDRTFQCQRGSLREGRSEYVLFLAEFG